MKKNVLITGGAGFIGTNLRIELESRGHQVFIADLLNENKESYYRCDVSNYRHLEKVFSECPNFDFVYHLAAEYGRWNGEAHYENLWSTNVIGTKNILRLQERYGFKLIFFSSAEVYGDYSGEMIEELMFSAPINETYQMNDYAISKWAGELMCMNAAKMHGAEIVRTRPVNCYGPHEEYNEYRGFIPKFIYQALHNEPITVFAGHKRIIDFVGDSVKTWANISDNFIPGEVYNVGSRQEWELEITEVANIVLAETGASSNLLQIMDKEPHTTDIKTISSAKAIRDLSHNPTVSPREGIKETVDWMKWYYRL
ncbi:NAD(P)-dependent oxidoreductase [bacterium]|nr:NAD(P)-dependent oxidoreductase [bacterium]MDB9962785.1 NAD(P)-dependent oxidoreductase [Planktomarina temperata]